MPRAIWSGSISFGLVNVPVKLYSAVKHRNVQFHQLEAKSGARVRNKRVSEKTGREVDYDDVVKGYELDKGGYVTIEPEELEAMAPENSHTIDVEEFVDLAAIDPMYFEKPYWVAVDGGKGPEKAYRLLVNAMEESDRIAIARFVMREKQYLCALRPVGNTIALHTMAYPDELVDRSKLKGTEVKASVSPKELKMALQFIDSLTVEWEPKRYHDTYREQVLDLVKRKAAGEEIVMPEPVEREAEVVDLMAALEASIERRKAGGRAGTAKKTGAKKATARKRAAKPSATKKASAKKAAARKRPARKSA